MAYGSEAPRPIVAGLSMRMHVGETVGPGAIGGPALYAAIGAKWAECHPQLMTALGSDLSSEEKTLLGALGDDARLVTTRASPMLTWRSAALLGEVGRGSLSGDPGCWRSTPDVSLLNDRVIILANGDPEWYAGMLTQSNPALIIMDVHVEWLRVRPSELNVCLRRSSLVTITEHEYRALPKSALSGCAFGQRGGAALVLKRGSSGVTVFSQGERIDLPPPIPSRVRTDVGCGDLLIGALSGYLLRGAGIDARAYSCAAIALAYSQAAIPVAKLIESENPYQFIGDAAASIRQRVLPDHKDHRLAVGYCGTQQL